MLVARDWLLDPGPWPPTPGPYTPPMPTTLLKLSCPDRPGLLARLTAFIAFHGGNLLEVNQFTDHTNGWFFARLAVFPDRFDLDAATAVAADPGDDALGLLTDLVRQSMVTVPGPDQFRLLDTLRAYAAELLADRDADATSERHARYYLELAERAEVGIRGPDQLPWLAHLRAAAPQHRAALEWLLSTGDGEGQATRRRNDPGFRLHGNRLR